jgi:23S rRNA (uracil1939-C5)-methyltransferase
MPASIDQVEITAMTFGPFGVGRADGKTVMVPNSAPGDVLEAQIVAERRDYAIAKIRRIVREGAARRNPPCRFLPRCGGCDWQQIAYAHQVELKGGLIASAFRQALGIQLDPRGLVEPAPAEFGYRARIRLKTGAEGSLGFSELGSNALVAIDGCLVAAPEIRLPTELARLLGHRCTEMEVVAAATDNVVIAWLGKPPRPSDVAASTQMVESREGLGGVVLRSGQTRLVIGDARIEIEVEHGCIIRGDADLFSQVNRAQNRKLVASVMETAAVAPGQRVLDLFCGAGNFSLPAARRGAEVTGVDADELAIAAARDNAARMNLPRAQFVAMRAAETANFLARARYRPELLIIDPPRSGAAELMGPIARLRPCKAIYVSCDLSTLVRDLRSLSAHGYTIERVRAFDFFPNTHHLEVVASVLLT